MHTGQVGRASVQPRKIAIIAYGSCHALLAYANALVRGIGAAQVFGCARHQRQEYSLLYGDANNPLDRKQCGIAKNKEFNEG